MGCAYKPLHPLQSWGGRMPIEIIYPLVRCRVGDTRHFATCPYRPVELPSGWGDADGGMYGADALRSQPDVPCLALPVLSADRDPSDNRNIRLQQDGLSLQDL